MISNDAGVIDLPFKMVVTAIAISLMASIGWHAVDRAARTVVENRMELVIDNVMDAVEYVMTSPAGTTRSVNIDLPEAAGERVAYILFETSGTDGHLSMSYRYSFEHRDRVIVFSWIGNAGALSDSLRVDSTCKVIFSHVTDPGENIHIIDVYIISG